MTISYYLFAGLFLGTLYRYAINIIAAVRTKYNKRLKGTFISLLIWLLLSAVIMWFLAFFTNSTFAESDCTVGWREYAICALYAIVLDIVFSLGFSMTESWSAATTKISFATFLKKIISPSGVAVAIVTFAICIASAYLKVV